MTNFPACNPKFTGAYGRPSPSIRKHIHKHKTVTPPGLPVKSVRLYPLHTTRGCDNKTSTYSPSPRKYALHDDVSDWILVLVWLISPEQIHWEILDEEIYIFIFFIFVYWKWERLLCDFPFFWEDIPRSHKTQRGKSACSMSRCKGDHGDRRTCQMVMTTWWIGQESWRRNTKRTSTLSSLCIEGTVLGPVWAALGL